MGELWQNDLVRDTEEHASILTNAKIVCFFAGMKTEDGASAYRLEFFASNECLGDALFVFE